ncbi:MAG: hypothetical protein JXP72_09455 [Coriobacteriia bacterium]|nr:hypothetical protein [Coriobacteriia bacterium]
MRRLRAPVALLLTAVLVLAAPAPAVAAPRGPLAFIKNTIDRVLDLAERITEPPRRVAHAATRWMGPVLGPLAADFALGQIISSRSSVRQVFQRLAQAERVSQNIEQVQKDTERLRQAYRDEAQAHREYIEQLQWQADAIKNAPVTGDVGELIRIRSLQDGHRRMAERLDARASSVSTEDVIGLATRRIVRDAVGGARAIITQEARSEIERLLGIEVIEDFSVGGLGAEQVVELVLGADVDLALIRAGVDPGEVGDVRDRIRDRLREDLRARRSNLRETWPGVVRQVVSEAVNGVRADSVSTGSGAFTIVAPYGIVIEVFADNKVRGRVDDSETSGDVTVTMKATFEGTISEDGTIVASGTYTGTITTPTESANEAGTVTVRARRISEDTFEVMVTPAGGSALARSAMGTVTR